MLHTLHYEIDKNKNYYDELIANYDNFTKKPTMSIAIKLLEIYNVLLKDSTSEFNINKINDNINILTTAIGNYENTIVGLHYLRREQNRSADYYDNIINNYQKYIDTYAEDIFSNDELILNGLYLKCNEFIRNYEKILNDKPVLYNKLRINQNIEFLQSKLDEIIKQISLISDKSVKSNDITNADNQIITIRNIKWIIKDDLSSYPRCCVKPILNIETINIGGQYMNTLHGLNAKSILKNNLGAGAKLSLNMSNIGNIGNIGNISLVNHEIHVHNLSFETINGSTSGKPDMPNEYYEYDTDECDDIHIVFCNTNGISSVSIPSFQFSIEYMLENSKFDKYVDQYHKYLTSNDMTNFLTCSRTLLDKYRVMCLNKNCHHYNIEIIKKNMEIIIKALSVFFPKYDVILNLEKTKNDIILTKQKYIQVDPLFFDDSFNYEKSTTTLNDKEIVDKMQFFLIEYKKCKNKNIVVWMFDFLLENIQFVLKNNNFYKTIINKLNELQSDLPECEYYKKIFEKEHKLI